MMKEEFQIKNFGNFMKNLTSNLLCMDYNNAKKYIIKKLEDELPKNLYYHRIDHTFDVLNSVKNYALLENINEENTILLKTAALFHDSGFIKRYFDNEKISINILKKILPNYNYSDEQIEVIRKMILSTKIPQNPKSILDEILCDSDLDYLGRDDFFMTSAKLLYEWNHHGIITPLRKWYTQETCFMQQHKYFTKSAIKLRQEKKAQHLSQIIDLLNNK